MKKKNRIVSFISIFLVSLLIMTPLALGATRASYLLNFIVEQQNANNRGFGDSHESTARALEMLEYFGALGSVNSSETQQYLKNEIENMFDTNDLNVYDIYYLLKSLDILNTTDTEVPVSLRNKIINYLEDLNQTGSGFSPTNKTGSSSTMISTYFAIEAYSILLNENFEILDTHKTWIKSCFDAATGGYKGNTTASTTSLMNTYCAILIMNRAEALGELTNKPKTITYCESFFVSIPSDQDNYGGYLPDLTADYACLSSTYYCVKVLDLLTTNYQKVPSINWIYSCQNFKDGGFVDIGDESVQGLSSIISSYFALESLTLLGGSLDLGIWMVEFNFIILIVLLIILAIIIGLAIFFWRRRRI